MEDNNNFVKDITIEIPKEKIEEVEVEEEQVKGAEVELEVDKEQLDEEKKFVAEEKKGLEKERESLWGWKEKITSFFKDKYNLLFVLVLILGFLIRLKYIGQESLWNDAAVHLWFVIKVVKEPLFMFSNSYLLGDYFIVQTVMAFFYLFTKNAFLAGKIVAMIYALAGIVFMYLLGIELKDKFTGILAAALLAFNHIFWFYGVRPLGDSPLLVTTIILLYCMVKLEKLKTLKWGILSGIMFLAAVFTKKQAVIFIFALLIYYLVIKRKEMVKDKALLISWLIPGGAMVFAHFFSKFVMGAGSGVLTRVFRLFTYASGMPYGFEAAGMLQWIFTWYLVPFVILGALFVLIYKKKRYYFSLFLFAVYWLYFEINVDNTQDRYMLPLLSVAIILAVFAIEEISSFIAMFTHKKLKYVLVLAIVTLICWNFYQLGDPLIYNKSFSYVGHEDAGEWMKANIPEDAPIFAGSFRFVRLFTERETGGPGNHKLGGSIWNLRAEGIYDYNKSAFEEDLKRLSEESDVYLEIDHIEYTQPSWYYPLSEESFNYFQNLGFNLVHVGEGTVLTEDGPKKTPMIFIFRKEKES
jgi:hypothetical protein